MGDLHYVQDRNYLDGSLISEKFTEARNHFFNDYIKNYFLNRIGLLCKHWRLNEFWYHGRS